jgi:hypothetical protein
MSLYNWDKNSKFIVLEDRIFNIDGINRDTAYTKINKKLNFTTVFNAGSTTILKGALKLVAISDVPDSGGKPAIYAALRVKYFD